MKIKSLSLIFSFFSFLIILIQNVEAQNIPGHANKIYYKSMRGPYWTKSQLDSFLFSKKNNRYKLVARKIRVEKRNDSVIYFVNIRMDPVAVDNNNKPWVGQNLPAFILKDIDGKLINSKNLIGKPMVVNLWFTTCGPCIEEMPDLNKLRKEYEDSDVVFLAITFDTKISVVNFLKKHPFNFLIIPDARQYCDHITSLYPVTLFVDRNGTIQFAEHLIPSSFDPSTSARTGHLDLQSFEKNIDTIIEERKN